MRYIRRSLGEIAVLRELVSLQHCKIINPSEFWLAQMTSMSERSVRRALVKLKKSGLISFDKHKQDFRGPLRPTNTYTLHPERIQKLIDAGKVAVKRAMDQYYEHAGTPRHGRKRPARLTGHPQEQAAKLAGYTTGQIGPQDVSLSKEQDYVEDSPSSFGEADREVKYRTESAMSDDIALALEETNVNWEESQDLDIALKEWDSLPFLNHLPACSLKVDRESLISGKLMDSQRQPSPPRSTTSVCGEMQQYAFSRGQGGIVYIVPMTNGRPSGSPRYHHTES